MISDVTDHACFLAAAVRFESKEHSREPFHHQLISGEVRPAIIGDVSCFDPKMATNPEAFSDPLRLDDPHEASGGRDIIFCRNGVS